jgi:hypothetical protein
MADRRRFGNLLDISFGAWHASSRRAIYPLPETEEVKGHAELVDVQRRFQSGVGCAAAFGTVADEGFPSVRRAAARTLTRLW